MVLVEESVMLVEYERCYAAMKGNGEDHFCTKESAFTVHLKCVKYELLFL